MRAASPSLALKHSSVAPPAVLPSTRAPFQKCFSAAKRHEASSATNISSDEPPAVMPSPTVVAASSPRNTPPARSPQDLSALAEDLVAQAAQKPKTPATLRSLSPPFKKLSPLQARQQPTQPSGSPQFCTVQLQVSPRHTGLEAQEAADYEMRVRAAEERDSRLASGGARGASSDDEEAGGNTEIAAAAQRAQELGKARRKTRRSGGSGNSSGSASDSGFGSGASSGDDADAWLVASRAAMSRSHLAGSGSHQHSSGSASSVTSGSESDAAGAPIAPELVPVATAARLLAELEGNTSEHESYQQEASYASGTRSGEDDGSSKLATKFDRGVILSPEPLSLAASVLAKQQGAGADRAAADGAVSDEQEGPDVPWTGPSHHDSQPSACCSSGALPDLIEAAHLPDRYADARAAVTPSDAWVLGSTPTDPSKL